MERLTNNNEEIKTLQAENEVYWLKAYFKLKEYEEAEEQGLLVRLPCKYVYFLVDVNSKWGGMVMKKPIKDLTLFEIEQVDKRKYYSTKEKAEAVLAEMEG